MSDRRFEADPLAPGGVHASAVAFGTRAVLIRGPSNSGKSALALALLSRRLFDGTTGRLVADDRVLLSVDGDRLVASPPAALEGLIEVRGVGLLRLPAFVPSCPIALVLDLADEDGRIGRLPDRFEVLIAGIPLPLVIRPPRSSAEAADLVVALLSGAERLDPERG